MMPFYGSPLFFDPAESLIIFENDLRVGDSWCFSCGTGRYGDGTWTASITFAAGITRLTAAATLDGDRFKWLIGPSQTVAITPQPYQFVVSVTNGTDQYTLQSGGVVVAPNLGSNFNIDNQTALGKMLAACDASLLSLITNQVSTAQWAGRMYTMLNVRELWLIRDDLYERVREESVYLSGNKRGRRIIPRFVDR